MGHCPYLTISFLHDSLFAVPFLNMPQVSEQHSEICINKNKRQQNSTINTRYRTQKGNLQSEKMGCFMPLVVPMNFPPRLNRNVHGMPEQLWKIVAQLLKCRMSGDYWLWQVELAGSQSISSLHTENQWSKDAGLCTSYSDATEGRVLFKLRAEAIHHWEELWSQQRKIPD